MPVSVVMPQLGESVTEGTVTRWLKKEGEHVSADEPLLEVSTDKVDTEIPSPATGILRGIVVDEDETVAVGAQLAFIDDLDSAGSSASAPGASSVLVYAPRPPTLPFPEPLVIGTVHSPHPGLYGVPGDRHKAPDPVPDGAALDGRAVRGASPRGGAPRRNRGPRQDAMDI